MFSSHIDQTIANDFITSMNDSSIPLIIKPKPAAIIRAKVDCYALIFILISIIFYLSISSSDLISIHSKLKPVRSITQVTTNMRAADFTMGKVIEDAILSTLIIHMWSAL